MKKRVQLCNQISFEALMLLLDLYAAIGNDCFCKGFIGL